MVLEHIHKCLYVVFCLEKNSYWKEALKILKLVVTRSSSLQVVPQGSPTTSSGGSSHLYHGSFSDSEVFCKKV